MRKNTRSAEVERSMSFALSWSNGCSEFMEDALHGFAPPGGERKTHLVREAARRAGIPADSVVDVSPDKGPESV